MYVSYLLPTTFPQVKQRTGMIILNGTGKQQRHWRGSSQKPQQAAKRSTRRNGVGST